MTKPSRACCVRMTSPLHRTHVQTTAFCLLCLGRRKRANAALGVAINALFGQSSFVSFRQHNRGRRESTPALPLPDQSCRRHPVPSAVRRRRYGLLPRTQYLYNLTSININKCALGDAGLVESDRTRSWVSLVPKRRMTSHDMMSLRARCPRGYHATDSITLSANAVRGNQTYMVTLGTGNDDYK